MKPPQDKNQSKMENKKNIDKKKEKLTFKDIENYLIGESYSDEVYDLIHIQFGDGYEDERTEAEIEEDGIDYDDYLEYVINNVNECYTSIRMHKKNIAKLRRKITLASDFDDKSDFLGRIEKEKIYLDYWGIDLK